MLLYGYYQSSAAWRVRIALALKGIAYDQAARHLRHGEQRDAGYLRINPQGLVPALVLDSGAALTQSLAICEYLDEVQPEPSLLPGDALLRARIRAFAYVIACDIHPVQNLRILKRLGELGQDEEGRRAWARQVIADGFAACAALLDQSPPAPYCFGDRPSLADICLVPQLANARRFGVDLRWPRLLEIEARCLASAEFAETAPARQPDAE